MLDDAPFHAGTILDGRFRLERPLGEGGMGTVWAAHQIRLDRRVAIKVLRLDRARSTARLENEARTLASVKHPSIVQVFDYGQTESGHGYVAMEFVDGPTLEQRLQSIGRMRCEDAVTLVLPLLEGLAAVHAAGVVHRDIKPANILLAREGTGASVHVVPKLVDFGIAKSGSASSLTLEGDVIGTPAYMAPEQLAAAPIDARTDLWALASTIHDMIAGEPPFLAPNLFEMMRRIREEPPPFPRQASGLDGTLWAILTSALRKTPSDRPSDASELHTRLRAWLASKGGPRDLVFLLPSTTVDGPRARRVSSAPTSAPEQPTRSDLNEPLPSLAESDEAVDERPSFDALIRERLKNH